MELFLGLDVICQSKEMPMGIKGLVKKYKDIYYIFINSNLNEIEQCKTVMHELDHIKSGDFDLFQSASLIEKYNEYIAGGDRK